MCRQSDAFGMSALLVQTCQQQAPAFQCIPIKQVPWLNEVLGGSGQEKSQKTEERQKGGLGRQVAGETLHAQQECAIQLAIKAKKEKKKKKKKEKKKKKVRSIWPLKT